MPILGVNTQYANTGTGAVNRKICTTYNVVAPSSGVTTGAYFYVHGTNPASNRGKLAVYDGSGNLRSGYSGEFVNVTPGSWAFVPFTQPITQGETYRLCFIGNGTVGTTYNLTIGTQIQGYSSVGYDNEPSASTAGLTNQNATLSMYIDYTEATNVSGSGGVSVGVDFSGSGSIAETTYVSGSGSVTVGADISGSGSSVVPVFSGSGGINVSVTLSGGNFPFLRVYCIGTSTTAGNPHPELGGYRKILQDLLAPSYDYNFVGSSSAGPVGYDNNYSGTGMYISGFYTLIQNELATYMSSLGDDIPYIILQLGDYDVAFDTNTANYAGYAATYAQILDYIHNFNSNIRIICVNRKPTSGNSAATARADFLNDLIDPDVMNRPYCTLYDLYSEVIGTADWATVLYEEPTHFSATGYNLLATGIYPLIDNAETVLTGSGNVTVSANLSGSGLNYVPVNTGIGNLGVSIVLSGIGSYASIDRSGSGGIVINSSLSGTGGYTQPPGGFGGITITTAVEGTGSSSVPVFSGSGNTTISVGTNGSGVNAGVTYTGSGSFSVSTSVSGSGLLLEPGNIGSGNIDISVDLEGSGSSSAPVFTGVGEIVVVNVNILSTNYFVVTTVYSRTVRIKRNYRNVTVKRSRMIETRYKDPNATLDFAMLWLDELGTDTITSSEWLPVDGITIVSDTFTQTTSVVWLSGGSTGAIYTLTNRIQTATGRIDDRSVKIQVLEM